MALRIGDEAPDFTAATTQGVICFHEMVTPMSWKQGEHVIIVPARSDADAKESFPEGRETLKPSLRVVPQPR